VQYARRSLEGVRISKQSDSVYTGCPLEHRDLASGFSGDIGFPRLSDILKKEGGELPTGTPVSL